MHEQVTGLLDRMLADSSNITLTTKQCSKICQKYNISGDQLEQAIRQYCLIKDIHLEKYKEECLNTV